VALITNERVNDFIFLRGLNMRQGRVFIILFVILSAGCGVYASGVIYVDADEPNEPGSGTYNDPFGRIQDAIDTAQNGDVIEILPGIYTGEGNFNLDPMGKSITIRSSTPEDEDIVAATIIDPNGFGPGFYLYSGEDSNCIIEGLTIRNGYRGKSGGGFSCYNSQPTIRNCIVKSCATGTHGGGMYFMDSTVRVSGCVIRDNIATVDGGGIECFRSSGFIVNCLLFSNRTDSWRGGGIDSYGCNGLLIRNCTFAANTAYRGGGIYAWDSSLDLSNNILWENEAETDGPAIGIYGLSTVRVSYSDIDGGQEAIWDDADGLIWGSGNIDVQPEFATYDISTEHGMWDFHLQSEFGRWDKNIGAWAEDSITSLCIDAGDPNTDYSGESWPHGGRVNIGAYGGSQQASRNGNIADFDINGSVDAIDLSEFVYYWLAGDGGIVNLDLKGVVNTEDFAILAENWLWQKQ
jgi:predicted outer membrane repeat protein